MKLFHQKKNGETAIFRGDYLKILGEESFILG